MSRPGSSKKNRKDDSPSHQWKPKITDGPRFKLLPKHKKELYEIFEMLDDGSGTIKIKEVQTIFKSMNFIPDDAEMKRLFKGIKSDKISVENLITIMENKLSEADDHNELRRIFTHFDVGGKGYITFADLQKIAKEMQIDIQEEEIREMIEEADVNRDNQVSEEEFINVMLKVDSV